MNLAELDHIARQLKFDEVNSKKQGLTSKYELQIIDARIQLWRHNYRDALEIINEVVDLLDEDQKILKFICLLTKIDILWVGQLDDIQDVNMVFEDLEFSYNSFSIDEKRELFSFEGLYLGWIGMKEAWRDWNLKKGISFFEDAKKLFQKLGFEVFTKNMMSNMGLAYTLLGELDKGLDLLTQASQLREKYNLENEKLYEDLYLGTNYLYRGDLKTALKYYLASDEGHQKYGSNVGVHSLQQIIFIYTELGRLEDAKIYLRLIENEKPKPPETVIEHCTAIILRKSQRGRDKAKAQEFFAKRVYDNSMRHLEFSESATFYLETLFEELEAYGGNEILQEIQSLTNRMQTLSQRFGNKKLLITTLIGKSKLAFIASDLQNAELHLDEAEKLIKENNLKLFFDQLEFEKGILENNKMKMLDYGNSQMDIRKKMDLADYKKYLDYAKRIADKVRLNWRTIK